MLSLHSVVQIRRLPPRLFSPANKKMSKSKLRIASSLLVFIALFFVSIQAAENPTSPKPHILKSLQIQHKTAPPQIDEVSRSCSYTVSIRTSCSSTRFTRDHIGIAFGDSYGQQVYAPRLDDPYSGTFESCSTDTYQLSGPCMNHVCYLYLVRVGSDGWMPESVSIYGYYSGGVTFYYNTFLPYGQWFGFNYCSGRSMISTV